MFLGSVLSVLQKKDFASQYVLREEELSIEYMYFPKKIDSSFEGSSIAGIQVRLGKLAKRLAVSSQIL